MPPEFVGDDHKFEDANRVPDKLTDEDMKFASPLIQVLSENLVKMIFSTDWHTRELSLNKIEEEVSLGKTSQIIG